MTACPQTTTAALATFVARHRPAVEESLERHLPRSPERYDTELNDAIRYAVFPGGKRIRPALTLLGARLFGGSIRDALPAAAAVEFIHTSSVIFDDLPSMDDSPDRRGKLALHVKHNEALAVLAAVSFLNASYKLVTVDVPADKAVWMLHETVDCVGPVGMIGGQAIDLTHATHPAMNLKTSSLMRLALRLGAVPAGATNGELDALTEFADLLGDAYQMSDDLIDASEDAVRSGHTAPSSTALHETADRARYVLTTQFPACEARDALDGLIEMVVSRSA
jgi:geranylgeranyl diphosphate synthase type II